MLFCQFLNRKCFSKNQAAFILSQNHFTDLLYGVEKSMFAAPMQFLGIILSFSLSNSFTLESERKRERERLLLENNVDMRWLILFLDLPRTFAMTRFWILKIWLKVHIVF